MLYVVRWAEAAESSPFAKQQGNMVIAAAGANAWTTGAPARHAYLQLRRPAGELAEEIERLMLAK